MNAAMNQPSILTLRLGQSDQAGQPQQLIDLKTDIESTLADLRLLYKDYNGELYRSAFRKLFGLARVGLAGPTPSPDVARAALDSLRNSILEREAGRIKNAYLMRLGLFALAFGGAVTGVYVVLSALKFFVPEFTAFGYENLLIVVFGCMLGAWLSFGVRKAKFEFSDLVRVESDRMEPWIRLIFVSGFSVILSLLISEGAFDLEIGDMAASDVMCSIPVAFLFGAACGLTEIALPSTVVRRTTAWLGSE